MEDEKDMYKSFLGMSKMLDIMYESYEKRMEREEREKERAGR